MTVLSSLVALAIPLHAVSCMQNTAQGLQCVLERACIFYLNIHAACGLLFVGLGGRNTNLHLGLTGKCKFTRW